MLDTSKIREHMDVISSDRKTVGQVEVGAKLRGHDFCFIERIHRRSPPPCWSRRALLLREAAPARIFCGNSVELQLRCLVQSRPLLPCKIWAPLFETEP